MMSEKQDMDDFASLFLPDLLNPLDSLPEEDRAKIHMRSREPPLQQQHAVSAPPSTSSSGMSLIRFFEASNPVSSLESDAIDPNVGFSDMGNYIQQQPPRNYVQGQSSAANVSVPLNAGNFPKTGAQDGGYGGENRGALAAQSFLGQYDAATPDTRNSAFAASVHGLSPFSHLDMGHTSHYAEYLAPEAAMAQPQRQRPFQGGMYHSGYAGEGHVTHDSATWPAQADPAVSGYTVTAKNVVMPAGFSGNALDVFGSDYYSVSWPDTRENRPGSRTDIRSRQGSDGRDPILAVSPEKSEDVAENVSNTEAALKPEDPAQNTNGSGETTEKKAQKNELKPRTKSSLAPVVPPITVDYSVQAVGQLIDLKHFVPAKEPPVTSSQGHPLSFSLRGFLNGRLMTNDQDNYNYIYLSAGSVDPSAEYNPQVISCYRRNFINLHLHLKIAQGAKSGDISQKSQDTSEDVSEKTQDFSEAVSSMLLAGEPILRLRLEVTAITNKKDSKPVILLDGGSESDQKDARRVGDNIQVDIIGPVHVIELSECAPNSFWKVKKLQFKSATANSTNLAFQTYYRFLARVIAETSAGDTIIEEVASNPIIVRGRNPSFYQAKNDILIKAKSPNVAASYQYASLNTPLIADHRTRKEVKSEADTGVSESGQMDANEADEPLVEGDVVSEQTGSKNCDLEITSGEDDKNEVSAKGTNIADASKEKDEHAASSIPSGVDIQRILDAMSEKNGENYHYFPISNVYYLPPINVVYFPHAAHHTSIPREDGDSSKGQVSSMASTDNSGRDRKGASKVYFR